MSKVSRSVLKSLVKEHFKETQSKTAENILENFEGEVRNFKQVCPKEMVNKLSNLLSLKNKISKAI